MNIIKNLVPPARWAIKCPNKMIPEFIVVHNTANDASVVNEIAFMLRNNNKVSYHYAIDDKQIIQGIPEDRNAWHAGDGGNGPGNRKGIGIEICYSKSGGKRFEDAEILSAKFIASLLHAKGWGLDKVKKHQDFSGKYCPHRTLDLGWTRFMNMIKAELDALKVPAWEQIIRKNMNSPEAWITYVNDTIKDPPQKHPVAKFLREFIEKLGGRA
jgi:N-acetylmuramoyl-L-alanine amidase